MTVARDGLDDATRRQEVHVQSFDCRNGLSARLIQILAALCLMVLAHVSYASPVGVVPEHLIGLTQSLVAQVKDADFPTSEIKDRANGIIARSRLKNWRGAKIAVADFSADVASLLKLDYARADHRQIVSNVLSAKTEVEQRLAISAAPGFRNGKAPNVPIDSDDEQRLTRALQDYRALMLNKLESMERSATINIGERGESLTLEWEPDIASFSMRLVSADNDDIIIHGGVTVKRNGDLLNFEVDRESAAITVLDEDKRKQMYSAVFGDWIDAQGATWTISTSSKAPDESAAEDKGHTEKLNSLQAQLADLQNNKTYIWTNADTGEEIIQKKFKRLKEPFEYDAKKSQSLSQGKIDELIRQISELKLLDERLPVDKFDPTNSRSTISRKARVPVSITVTELSGYFYEYDFAEYDGDRIFARRTLTDSRDFSVPPDKVIAELIDSWSPPEWLELKLRYHPRTDGHSLHGDKWLLNVTYDPSTERVGSIHTPYRLAQSLTRETTARDEGIPLEDESRDPQVRFVRLVDGRYSEIEELLYEEEIFVELVFDDEGPSPEPRPVEIEIGATSIELTAYPIEPTLFRTDTAFEILAQ